MSSPCSSSHHSVSEPSLPSPMYRQLSQLISLILHSSPTTKCHTSHTVFFHQSCYPWSQDSSFFSFSLHSLLHILFWSLTFSFYSIHSCPLRSCFPCSLSLSLLPVPVPFLLFLTQPLSLFPVPFTPDLPGLFA